MASLSDGEFAAETDHVFIHPLSSDTARIPAPIVNRGGEGKKTFFRSDRYFAVGHQWYAAMREGLDLGPFADRDQAEIAVASHVAAGYQDAVAILRRSIRSTDREPTVLEILMQELARCRVEQHARSDNRLYVWAQRRLEAIKKDPGEFSYAPVRVRALRHFLDELGA